MEAQLPCSKVVLCHGCTDIVRGQQSGNAGRKSESGGENSVVPLRLYFFGLDSWSLSINLASKMASSAQERFDLINDNLAEILNPELIQSILDEGKNPRIYWGTF